MGARGTVSEGNDGARICGGLGEETEGLVGYGEECVVQ